MASGVSLIEVLIAMFILSFGLLGIAGLQAGVAKYKVNTWARTAISSLYSDMTDRIRMNSDVAGTNFITGVTSTSQYLLSDTWATQQSATLTTPSPNCETAACTPTERAAYDMVVWRQLVRAKLPGGSALISGDRSTSIRVTLMWFDKGNTEEDGATLDTAETCTSSMSGMRLQSCCPTAASVPAGVRCANFTFIP
jgi:type IV pilus assembly protein PilV